MTRPGPIIPTIKQHGRVAALMLVLGLIACQSPTAPVPTATPRPSPAKVRFGLLPSIATAPVYVGVESGAYAAEGLDVDVTPMADGVQVIVSIATGQLDMGQSAMGAATLNVFNRGTDVIAIASANQDPPAHGSVTPILVRTDLYDSGQIRGPEQLRGRRVGSTAPGTIGEYSLGKYLQQGGLTLNDVEMVNVPRGGSIPAFANRAIDVAVPLEPAATEVVRSGVARVLADNYQPDAQLGLIIVNTRWAESHPDVVVNFLTGFVKSIRRLSDGHVKTDQAALAAIEKFVNIGPDSVRLAPDPYWPKDGKINRQSLEEEQAFFLANKGVDFARPIPIDRLVDERYLAAALQRVDR